MAARQFVSSRSWLAGAGSRSPFSPRKSGERKRNAGEARGVPICQLLWQKWLGERGPEPPSAERALSSQTLTYEIILTLGQAFEVAYQLALQAQRVRPVGASAAEPVETKSSKPVPKPRAGVRRSAVGALAPRGLPPGCPAQGPSHRLSVCCALHPRCRCPPTPAVVTVTPAPPIVLLTCRCRLSVLESRSLRPCLCPSSGAVASGLRGVLLSCPPAVLSASALSVLPRRPVPPGLAGVLPRLWAQGVMPGGGGAGVRQL